LQKCIVKNMILLFLLDLVDLLYWPTDRLQTFRSLQLKIIDTYLCLMTYGAPLKINHSIPTEHYILKS